MHDITDGMSKIYSALFSACSLMPRYTRMILVFERLVAKAVVAVGAGGVNGGVAGGALVGHCDAAVAA